MAFYAQAAADFLEAVAMRDVASDIAEMSVEDFLAPWRGASLRRGVAHVARHPISSAAAATSVIGAIGLPAAISLLNKHKKNRYSKNKGILYFTYKMSYTGPYAPSVHRSFSLYRSPPKLVRETSMPRMARKRTYSSGNRYAPYGRKASKQPKKNWSTPLKFSASAKNRISKGSVTSAGRNVIVKKLALAPNPTSQELGGTLNFLIKNSQLRSTPAGQGSFGYAFKLSQFPQFNEYTDLYQWYKILSVRLTFYPEQNTHENISLIGGGTYNGSGGQTATAPVMVICPDQTSDATFGSIGNAMAHHDSRFHSFNDGKEFSIYLSPKPNSLIGNSGGEVTTLSSANKWITTNSAEVEHYGLRCFVDRMNDATSIYTVMEMKVAFREPKT